MNSPIANRLNIAAINQLSLPDAARTYAEAGIAIFPLVPMGKAPRIAGGFKSASSDLAQVQAWWPPGSLNNIGIPTGAVNKYIVVDIDVKNGTPGFESWEKLYNETGALEPTLSSDTPSGGMHVVYSAPDGVSIGNKVGFMPGIDVRGDGGYFVASPSVVAGKPYQWQEPAVQSIEMPKALVRKLTEKRSPHPARISSAADSAEPVTAGSRNEKLFRLALSQMKAGHSRVEVEAFSARANELFQPPMDHDEVMQVVDNVFRLYEKAVHMHCTDSGNAAKLAELYGDMVRYVIETDSWLRWNGVYWEPTSYIVIQGLAKDVAKAHHKEADAMDQGPVKTRLKKHALASEGATRIKDMITLFKSEPGIGLPISKLDSDGFLLGVQNGYVNLKTGQFHAPDQSKLITQVAGASYQPEATCPQWITFLEQVMGGDMELVTYLQRLIGYSLTASLIEQCMGFGYGYGANGKSTFLNVTQSLMGDYGAQASGDLLLDRQRNSSGPSGDIASLRGKRFVAMSEVDEGRHFSEALVKSMTGGDPIVARHMYQSQFTFVPTHKMFVAGNHKPVIKGTDEGIWRRMRLIPFPVSFKKEDRDPNLESKLKAELPGILNWAIRGCLDWQRHGLPIPTAVAAATAEYRSEMDVVGSWIREYCVEGPFLEMVFDEAYESFSTWAKDYFGFSYTKRKLGMLLIERGYEKAKTAKRKYIGLGLRTPLTEALQKNGEKLSVLKMYRD
ncbi:bifunctional DNA primase/polymerase [Duganella sp. FT3S]|uniref:Bifunctional DNA primase/polymerase n=1 Tax=Rugamonas fusca TaxID=2758568 RepID=A0A7W2EIX3_9BURK|nr:phage/plasmid primase, P4 family [Rugamonas fusca]MBA5606787.1 bifunctional DNA primase/polymerase [Rugamonas fusca]